MLSRLRLINFRRHVDTELTFSPDAQVIAITGANGTGKTTILEALTYALYGESRYGRRNLARLVRRGAEHEGMQVEVAFQIGDVEYDLVRRHEKSKTSATLMANGNLIMQSADGVTAEIAKIFGMDSTGFRLAVIAQQFDVEGLADLTPPKRRATVTRLLRQDALTRAKVAAAGEKNRNLDVLRALGTGPDMEELDNDVTEAAADVAASQEALTQSAETLATLDKQLADTHATRTAWQDAQIAVATAQALVTAALAEVDRADAEVAGLYVPDEPTHPGRGIDEITADLTDVNIAIAQAKDGAQLARVAEQTRAELATVTADLAKVEKDLAGVTPATLALAAVTAATNLATAQADLKAATDRVAQVGAERVGPAGELVALRARRARMADLGAVCDACDQPISDEHRHTQEEASAAREAELVATLAALDEARKEALATVERAQDAVNAAVGALEQARARKEVTEAALARRKDLTSRHKVYTERLARLPEPAPVDVEDLYTRKGDLEVQKAAVEQYESTMRARTAALERAELLTARAKSAHERLEAAQGALEAAQPSQALRDDYRALADLERVREGEAELAAALRTELARAQARHTGAVKVREAAMEQVARMSGVREAADRAAKAARLLDVTAERMATQIRPALQGAISDVLTRLSEGRFTKVEIDDSYEITVLDDDGKYYPLTEISGGERVLVALATRLALAQVVAGRHQDGGVGLLVLDEVFGSQDEARREAIMAGLRALRAEYGQILLISHVGGLEEAADRVIDVTLQVADGGRVAEVTGS